MPLLAAVGQVDVTPTVGGPLAGYGDRGPSTGVLGPICAGVLALDDAAGCRVVVVMLDAVGVGLAVADRLRVGVAAAAGTTADRVLLNCSHNHSGPSWFDGDASEAADADRMIGALTHEAARIVDRLRPVQIGLATGETDVAVNRRVTGADGKAVMGTNDDGFVDRHTTTLVISECEPERQPGNAHAVLATLTIAALHGNCLKGDNTCLAPDFVGAFRDALSEQTGAPAFFIQGCAGDLNPRWRGGPDEAERTGTTLARHVATSLGEARPMHGTLGATSVHVKVPTRVKPSDLEARQLATTAAREWGQDVSAWLAWLDTAPEGSQMLPADMTVLRIGDLVIGGVPWELFSSIGARARQPSGQVQTELVGYTNGYYGYLAEPHDIQRGGYEIDWQPIVYGLATGMPLPMADDAADVIVEAFHRAANSL